MWHKNRHFQLINDKIHNKMKKMRAAIIGYGNIGKYVLDALSAAPDFEIAGIVSTTSKNTIP